MSIPHHSTNASSLAVLLAAGSTKSEAAEALGITPSAVTQLALDEQIQKSSKLDSKYDSIENKLLDQLERTIPMLMRPDQIARTLQIVNGAKRRGVAAQLDNTPKQVISLTLPTTIQNRFVLNSSNQVVAAGNQELVTMQSANVQKLLENSNVNSSIEKELGFDSPAEAKSSSD